MSKNTATKTTSKGAKGASKSKAPPAPVKLANVAIQSRNADSRTFKIEAALVTATSEGRKLTMRELEALMREQTCNGGRPVLAIAMHTATLYKNRMIDVDKTTGRNCYFVRPEVMQMIGASNGAPVTYGAVAASKKAAESN